jgi:nucleotide-binding universal stress UspA family protein
MTHDTNSQKVLSDRETGDKSTKVGFRKILVAVDYLTSETKLFEEALQIAQINCSRVMVFHCLKEPVSGMPEFLAYAGMGAYSGIYKQEIIELEEQLVKEATEELHAWLNSFVSRAREVGIEAEFEYVVGDPGKQICTFAREWGADLIVVGHRGRVGLSELLLGSVSNYVVHHAHCSVAIVQ